MITIKLDAPGQEPFRYFGEDVDWRVDAHGVLFIVKKLLEPVTMQNDQGVDVEIDTRAVFACPMASVIFVQETEDPPEIKKAIEDAKNANRLVKPVGGMPPSASHPAFQKRRR